MRCSELLLLFELVPVFIVSGEASDDEEAEDGDGVGFDAKWSDDDGDSLSGDSFRLNGGCWCWRWDLFSVAETGDAIEDEEDEDGGDIVDDGVLGK